MILMLYVQRNLRLHLLQNGLIILTFFWRLMRMVNFTRDSMASVMTDFPTVHFPYLSSNITESPAYGVFASQLIRYARVCSKYEDFLFRWSILVSKLLKQGYSSRKLQTTFWKFYGRHIYIGHKFDTSVSHMLKGLFTNCDIRLVSSNFVWIVDGCHMWGM